MIWKPRENDEADTIEWYNSNQMWKYTEKSKEILLAEYFKTLLLNKIKRYEEEILYIWQDYYFRQIFGEGKMSGSKEVFGF